VQTAVALHDRLYHRIQTVSNDTATPTRYARACGASAARRGEEAARERGDAPSSVQPFPDPSVP